MLFNHLDLFSGIGGFALGARMAGLKIDRHFYSEIDKHAIRVYRKNFPAAESLGRIERIQSDVLRRIGGRWIVTGGFPCQDISKAGGANAEGIGGARSGLWFEMHRIIDDVRPAYVVIENVPTLCNRGLERVLFSLAGSGYDAEWRVISAAQVGAPHLRKRLWIIAYPSSNERGGGSQSFAVDSDLGEYFQSNAPTNGNDPWFDWERTCAAGAMGAEPHICGMDDGLSARVDRIRSLGNAIVPQIAEMIFRRIISLEGGECK